MRLCASQNREEARAGGKAVDRTARGRDDRRAGSQRKSRTRGQKEPFSEGSSLISLASRHPVMPRSDGAQRVTGTAWTPGRVLHGLEVIAANPVAAECGSQLNKGAAGAARQGAGSGIQDRRRGRCPHTRIDPRRREYVYRILEVSFGSGQSAPAYGRRDDPFSAATTAGAGGRTIIASSARPAGLRAGPRLAYVRAAPRSPHAEP